MLCGWEGNLAESNGTAEWMTHSHLRAICLYTGISSGPNARQRVWEAFTFFILIRGSAIERNRARRCELKSCQLQLKCSTICLCIRTQLCSPVVSRFIDDDLRKIGPRRTDGRKTVGGPVRLRPVRATPCYNVL